MVAPAVSAVAYPRTVKATAHYPCQWGLGGLVRGETRMLSRLSLAPTAQHPTPLSRYVVEGLACAFLVATAVVHTFFGMVAESVAAHAAGLRRGWKTRRVARFTDPETLVFFAWLRSCHHRSRKRAHCASFPS